MCQSNFVSVKVPPGYLNARVLCLFHKVSAQENYDIHSAATLWVKTNEFRRWIWDINNHSSAVSSYIYFQWENEALDHGFTNAIAKIHYRLYGHYSSLHRLRMAHLQKAEMTLAGLKWVFVNARIRTWIHVKERYVLIHSFTWTVIKLNHRWS